MKFKKLTKEFIPPKVVSGYDTETFNGDIITQQFYDDRGGDIQWVNDDNVLDKFIRYIDGFPDGFSIMFVFNAPFDLPLLLRKYINLFLRDDFEIQIKGWTFKVFCTKNWHGIFTKGEKIIRFLDIRAFLSGNLESVAKTFNCPIGKLQRPEGLGCRRFTPKDRIFKAYAMQDARLCHEIGLHIVNMHKEFDIPISSSSANLAEKVFRRNFLEPNTKIQFPPYPCLRLSELSYHGGKNGYYLDGPAHIDGVFEYDFNAAYGFSMYNLPSFIEGEFVRTKKFSDKYPGVYQVEGTIQPCQYGILYDPQFNYFTFPHKQEIRSFCTSYEIQEALRSRELKIKSIEGYYWKQSADYNPIHEYAKHFWKKKNDTPKTDIRYQFYKLCLNSLYGKWIQRNPSEVKISFGDDRGELIEKRDTAGGLYHPFIASLITGFTRARLHQAEHYFDAIESSTDSVKSKIYDKEHDKEKGFGVMQLEHFKCKICEKPIKKANALFVRNRLNLIMDNKEHVLKCALHGFWGKPEELLRMYKERRTTYNVDRMPLIREGLKHKGKQLFRMYTDQRNLNIDWDELQEEKKKC